MRRTHLRGHDNILKLLLVHAGACNLGLWMRTVCGMGTPRGLQGRVAALVATILTAWHRTEAHIVAAFDHPSDHRLALAVVHRTLRSRGRG